MVHDPGFALIDPCVFWGLEWLLKTLRSTSFASFRYLLDIEMLLIVIWIHRMR